MSIFNAAYILLGLAMFVIGWLIVIHSLIGILPIIVGAFFFLLGINAVARGIR